jgi:hypothetical protein
MPASSKSTSEGRISAPLLFWNTEYHDAPASPRESVNMAVISVFSEDFSAFSLTIGILYTKIFA